MVRTSNVVSSAWRAVGLGALLAASALAGSARAVTISDPAGDFLSTYTGPLDGDLDVLSVSAEDSGTNVILSAVLNGDVGTTASGVYVWGVDRGAGQAFLQLGAPPVGAGVLFDAVVVLLPNGTGQVVDITGGTMTPLDAGAITISGPDLTAVVPLALLPSTGFATSAYRFNLGPRSGLGQNNQIADFAPDASTFAVPEPTAWALMVLGFGLMGAMIRRRRRRPARLAPA